MNRIRPHLPALALLLVAGAGLAWEVWVMGPERDPVADTRLMRALLSYALERRAAGAPLPASFGVGELVATGRLTADEARRYSGRTIRFHPDADEAHPQRILAEARMPDGAWMAVLGDGTVREWTPGGDWPSGDGPQSDGGAAH